MQTLILLFTTLAALTPADGPDRGESAMLLGGRAKPIKALVAWQLPGDMCRLEVLNAKGKALKTVTLGGKGKPKAPAFKRKALLTNKAVKKLFKEHDLKERKASRQAPARKVLASVMYRKNRVALDLVTASGRKQVAAYKDTDAVELQFYYIGAPTVLAVVGTIIDDAGQRSGEARIVKLSGGLKSLSDKQFAAALYEEAKAAMGADRYASARPLLKRALKAHKTAEGRYLATVCLARLGQWKAARDQLNVLRKDRGKSSQKYHRKAKKDPVVREALLRGVNLNRSSDYKFKAAKSFEGTSVWVKIKDADGNNIAVFKPTNGNTYHRGEVFTYQMSKLLGTEDMYPVTFLHTLDDRGCRKLVTALKKVKYKGMKEKNRKKLIRRCAKGGLEGAVKEWVRDFQFFGAIGKVKKLKRHHAYSLLLSKKARPRPGKKIKAKTVTRLYKPDHCKKATYLGKIDEPRMGRELSDMLVMDVLNGNEDRFPGANLEFQSLEGGKETKKCVFDFGPSRLFSLDNGATFKGTRSNAFVAFTKDLNVSRFSRKTFHRLKSLKHFLDDKRAAPGYLAGWDIATRAELWKFLALDKGDSHKRRKHPWKLFETNLRNVIKHMRRHTKNKNAWFKVR